MNAIGQRLRTNSLYMSWVPVGQTSLTRPLLIQNLCFAFWSATTWAGRAILMA